MNKILNLFEETRRLRLYYRSKGNKGDIEAAACAIRERALLDALLMLDCPIEKIKQLEKL